MLIIRIQLTLLLMSTWLLGTRTELGQGKELCVQLVIYKDCNKMHGQKKKKKSYVSYDDDDGDDDDVTIYVTVRC